MLILYSNLLVYMLDCEPFEGENSAELIFVLPDPLSYVWFCCISHVAIPYSAGPCGCLQRSHYNSSAGQYL